MVLNPAAEPIYHSLIMCNGAADTLILPVLSCFAAPNAATFAIVALWSWRARRSTQIVQPRKEGTHMTSVVTDDLPKVNTLYTHTHIDILCRTYTKPCTQFPLSVLASLHTPTTVWLSTAGEKWPITMATVCAVLLQLWCMWWHFWPGGELCNAEAVQTLDKPWLLCLFCRLLHQLLFVFTCTLGPITESGPAAQGQAACSVVPLTTGPQERLGHMTHSTAVYCSNVIVLSHCNSKRYRKCEMMMIFVKTYLARLFILLVGSQVTFLGLFLMCLCLTCIYLSCIITQHMQFLLTFTPCTLFYKQNKSDTQYSKWTQSVAYAHAGIYCKNTCTDKQSQVPGLAWGWQT